MATTKTLTPTNQAITLAAFTEKPDNRTNVTNDDKLADAVNALNSNLEIKTPYVKLESGSLLDYISNMDVGTKIIFIAKSAVTDKPLNNRGVAMASKSSTDEMSVLYSSVIGRTFTNNMFGAEWSGWKEIALESNFTTVDQLLSSETNVSAGNVQVPLDYNGKKYRFLEIRFNSASGNNAATRGTIIVLLSSNNALAATYMPLQVGTTTGWVRLQCNNDNGLSIITFGGVSTLYVTSVQGIGVVG